MRKIDICLILLLLYFLGCNDKNEIDLGSPEISTNKVQQTNAYSTLVIGELFEIGSNTIIDHGFALANHPEPTLEDRKISLGTTDSLGIFQSMIENLAPNQEYYVRAYIEYGINEIEYGNTLSFATLDVNTWIKKAEYSGSYLTGAASFVIDDKLFVGTGINDNYVNYFYAYDYQEDSWEKISSLPSDQRADGVSFSVGSYGYVGLGSSCVGEGLCQHYYYNDLWRYDYQNDRWTQMADFPGTPRASSTCFIIGNKAYVTGGSSYGDNDLWEYDTSNDTWTNKADYPGRCLSRGVAFSLNDKGYVGFGWSDGTCKDFWQYDPIADQWIKKKDFPGAARYDAVGFTVSNRGYLACGVNQDYTSIEYLTDVWEYDDENDTWIQIATEYPGDGRMDMMVGIVDNRIIMGLGASSTTNGPQERFEDVWEYIPEYR